MLLSSMHSLVVCFSDFAQVRSLRSWSEFNWLQSCFYYIMIQIILTCCRKTQCQVEYIFAIVFHKEQAVLQNHPVIYYWIFLVILMKNMKNQFFFKKYLAGIATPLCESSAKENFSNWLKIGIVAIWSCPYGQCNSSEFGTG